MKPKIKEVIRYFLRLGFIAFGGPAAHVALMEEELVTRKKWLSTEEFLDYMGVTNLIPGPNSTEMTMHCGYHRAGVAGLFAAGISFILPAALTTLLIGIFYESIKETPWVLPMLNGIKAAVIAFIVGAIYKLGRKSLKNRQLYFLAGAVVIASFWGLNEITVILLAGAFYVALHQVFKSYLLGFALWPLLQAAAASISTTHLFLIFLKVGAVLFGSGYVLFAYLDGELIQNLGWLTHGDLVEAIAVGQMTPGPILSTATFIGYKVAGIKGAFVATLGIFLPSFFYVWILNRHVHKIRSSKMLGTFLDGVNVAAVAVMLVVSVELMKAVVIDWRTGLICALSLVLHFGIKKINSLWLILGGGVLGFLFSFV